MFSITFRLISLVDLAIDVAIVVYLRRFFIIALVSELLGGKQQFNYEVV